MSLAPVGNVQVGMRRRCGLKWWNSNVPSLAVSFKAGVPKLTSGCSRRLRITLERVLGQLHE